MNVKNRADAVGTFRHVNVFLMETLAAWVPSTPEMEAKVLFGRHLWLAAQMADRLGKRARELRAPLQYTREPAAAFANALSRVAGAASTAARLDVFYGPTLDAIARAYRAYLASTDPVIDEPTVMILEDGLRDIERMRSESRKLMEEFPAMREPGSGASKEIERLLADPAGMVAAAAEEQTA